MLTVRTLAPLPAHEWSYLARVSLDDPAGPGPAGAIALGLLTALAIAFAVLLAI